MQNLFEVDTLMEDMDGAILSKITGQPRNGGFATKFVQYLPVPTLEKLQP